MRPSKHWVRLCSTRLKQGLDLCRWTLPLAHTTKEPALSHLLLRQARLRPNSQEGISSRDCCATDLWRRKLWYVLASSICSIVSSRLSTNSNLSLTSNVFWSSMNALTSGKSGIFWGSKTPIACCQSPCADCDCAAETVSTQILWSMHVNKAEGSTMSLTICLAFSEIWQTTFHGAHRRMTFVEQCGKTYENSFAHLKACIVLQIHLMLH